MIMKIRGIPRWLCTQVVVLYSDVSTTIDEEYNVGIICSGVAVIKTKRVKSDIGTITSITIHIPEYSYSQILPHDIFTFKAIEHNGKQYRIENITKYMNPDGSLHHYTIIGEKEV